MIILKKALIFTKLFLWYWILFGFLFIGCLMYRYNLYGLDFSIRFIIKHFFDYLITSMLFLLYPLFFAFIVSLTIYRKKKQFVIWVVFYGLSFPYIFAFYRICGFIIIIAPFIFWYFYLKYRGNKL
jgi:hypothetical protein